MKKYRLKVWGGFACFTRPEMKVERVSYDVITPSSAKAIFEAILWAPGIHWRIDLIAVLNPIMWTSIQRNEVRSKSAPSKEIFIEEERVQRSSLILKDVSYVIEASMILEKALWVAKKKYRAMFKRRALRGQCFTQPYLGCREFSCYFQLLDDKDVYTPIAETRDLGFMLHSLEYEGKKVTPKFSQLVMDKGVIIVPQEKLSGK